LLRDTVFLRVQKRDMFTKYFSKIQRKVVTFYDPLSYVM